MAKVAAYLVLGETQVEGSYGLRVSEGKGVVFNWDVNGFRVIGDGVEVLLSKDRPTPVTWEPETATLQWLPPGADDYTDVPDGNLQQKTTIPDSPPSG